MAQDRFLIAPIDEGRRTDVKPFLLPDEAFAEVDNAYVYRGRMRKRFGTRPMNTTLPATYQQLGTRLRINLGVINPAHALIGVVPGALGAVGQMFSVGPILLTVTTLGAANMMSNLAGMPHYSFNTATGAYNIEFIDGTFDGVNVYWYPALPVMGFITYETGAINNNAVFAFDTKFAYYYAATGWERLGAAQWTGTDTQFFWGTTWQGNTSYSNVLFVSNYNRADQIKYWDSANWTNFNPQIGPLATDTLESARLLITFKDRLVALNTIEQEGAGTYFTHNNRARWSQNGSPIQADAWRSDIAGKGGFYDAPTRQSIVTAQILRDRLIVYFENSTWELVYTGNEILPFRWQQLNTELGAESTFSQVPFDKVILGIGNTGIHACNGAQVERIDEKIPLDVFEIHGNNSGIERVAGIRDFYSEMVYWTLVYPPYLQTNAYKYPNRVMVYNYRANTWAYNDDSITAFGYFEQQDARTWANMNQTWADTTDAWASGQLSSNPRQIVAGNQEGFTFLIDVDNPRNAISLSINDIDFVNNIITVIDHNLRNEDFILIENCQGMADLNGNIYEILVIDVNHFVLFSGVIPAGYTGGGTITRVSRINILTKQYNFYLKDSRNAYVNKVDFLIDRNQAGQVTVNCYPSYSNLNIQGAPASIGTGILELAPYRDYLGNIIDPIEQFQSQYWHPLYFQVEGESVQFRITLSDAQLQTPNLALANFTLNAFAIYAMPTTSRLQ